MEAIDMKDEPVVLINAFEVSAVVDDAFVRAWQRARAFRKAQQGYLSSRVVSADERPNELTRDQAGRLTGSERMSTDLGSRANAGGAYPSKSALSESREPIVSRWKSIALPVLRLMHLLGLTMFVGSILGTIVLSLGAPATGDPNAVVFAWRAIGSANTLLTIPGLAITIVTGVLLVPTQDRSPGRERWATIKILAVLAIVVIAVALIELSEDKLRDLSRSLHDPAARAAFTEVAVTQGTHGAINLALVILGSVLAILKPRLGGMMPRRLRR